MTPGVSAELARRFALHLVTAGAERPMGVDQTNVSVVVDEAVVVKWLTPPLPAPHPGVETLRHLATVGFDETPEFLGAMERDGLVEAIVTRFIPGSQDGWEWFTDDVLAWLDARESAAPGDTVAGYEDLLATCRRIGSMAARLHHALASLPQPIPTVAPSTAFASSSSPDEPRFGDPAVDADGRGEHQRRLTTGAVLATDAYRLLDEAIAVVTAQDADWLTASAPRIRRLIDSLNTVGDIVTQPIHGDFHVGQILRAGATLWVTDFDGNPLADASGARRHQPPEIDLASLMQSVDHVARVAHRRRPDVASGVVDDLAAAGADEVLAGYLAALDYSPAGVPNQRLLTALRVGQELHELVYAARHLPHWRYVPAAALPSLLRRCAEGNRPQRPDSDRPM